MMAMKKKKKTKEKGRKDHKTTWCPCTFTRRKCACVAAHMTPLYAVYKWRKGVYAVEGELEKRTVTHKERSVS